MVHLLTKTGCVVILNKVDSGLKLFERSIKMAPQFICMNKHAYLFTAKCFLKTIIALVFYINICLGAYNRDFG